jgi:K+-transporting ATPase KdpF subunit
LRSPWRWSSCATGCEAAGMTAFYVLGAGLAMILFVYLLVALLRPELF